ncbi:hypothetical protein TNCV_672621 [Trichonephila clavipes]|nr:hypothetical protein TNCV_672621 [Trichonephila clavipes]
MALYRSPLTVTLWPSSFLNKYGPMIPLAHKAHQTVSFSGSIQAEVRSIAKQNFAYENREQRQSRFRPIRRIYALLDDRFVELPNQTENKSLDSC